MVKLAFALASQYNSAVGLKADLLECQKRLNQAVATSDVSLEVIIDFLKGT